MVVLQELDGEPEPPLVTRAEQLMSVAKARAKAKAKGKTSKRGRGRGRGSHGKGRGRAATANTVELVVSSQEPGLLDDEDDAGEDHGEAILKKPAAKAPPEDGEAEEDEEADDFKPVFKKPAAKLQRRPRSARRRSSVGTLWSLACLGEHSLAVAPRMEAWRRIALWPSRWPTSHS